MTLTKEWLLKTIAELEEERDATPGAVNEDADMALAAMKLALASLEAEAVAWISERNLKNLGKSYSVYVKHEPVMVRPIPLYTAPPAPVSVPTFDEWLEIRGNKPLGWVKDAMRESYDACRAAMLQGAELQNRQQNIPSTQFKPVADLYGLTSPTGGETSFTFDAVEARDFIDGGWSCQEYVELERFQDAVIGNSPVIPDGWVAVPVEPTEDMIVNGFESEPDESFSDEKEWEAYEAMSGCQQAAHRAKLCWAAMLSAAPKI